MRTLLAWPEDAPKDALFVKASMAYSRLFGDRRLFAAKIAYSVGVTRLVEESLGYLPSGLDYLRETIAFAPRDMQAWRDFSDDPKRDYENRIVCVPVFALMGESDGHEPLLLALARSGLDPFDFR